MRCNWVWFMVLSLVACAQLPQEVVSSAEMATELSGREIATARQLLDLLVERQQLRSLPARDLQRQLESLRSARPDPEPTEMSTALAVLRFASLASLPAAPLAEQRQALALLDDLLAKATAEKPANLTQDELSVAQLLRDELQHWPERRRLEEAQQQLQYKLREEQRLRLDAEAQTARLEQKLKALINIERRLLRRESNSSATGGRP